MALIGPNWQVDIPSLSQLVLNLESTGLKQLANSGVDIHTIDCMLKIGKVVPACAKFRSAIHDARKKQRSKQFWLYKTIELGTAINFPADVLLKTRAGENAIALVCSLVPVYSMS